MYRGISVQTQLQVSSSPGTLLCCGGAGLECPSLHPAAAPKQILYSNLFPGSVTALSQKTDRKHPDTHQPSYWSPGIAAKIEDHRKKHGLVILPLTTNTVLHCSLTAVPCDTQFAYHSLECFVM